MTSTQENTPPHPSSVTPTETETSVSSMTRASNPRGGNTSRYNRGDRSSQSHVTRQDDDLLFQDDVDYGVVVGGPSENRHLKFGKPYEEFVETMRDKMASKFSYGHFLLPLFNNLEDPLKSSKLTNRPKEDMSITDEDERKMHWEFE